MGEKAASEVLGLGNGEEGSGGEDVAWKDERPRKPSAEISGYLKSVVGSLESGLEEPEEAALVRNVLKELEGHEASVACAKRLTYMFEKFIAVTSVEQICTMLDNMKLYFGFVSSSREGSHVLQAVFKRVYDILYKDGGAKTLLGRRKPQRLHEEDGDDEPSSSSSEEEVDSEEDNHDMPTNPRKELRETMMDLAKTLVQKQYWWSMIFDPCSTHVVRSFMLLLAGQKPLEKKNGDRVTISQMTEEVWRRRKNPDAEFSASLNAFLVDMSKWERSDLMEACADMYASPAVQILLLHTLPKSKAWKKVLETVVKDKDTFWELCDSRVESYVMQIIVVGCEQSYFDEVLYPNYIKGEFETRAHEHLSNFVVQSALRRLHTEDQIREAVEELAEHIERLFKSNKLGVVWRLCEACKDAPTALQGRVCRSVMQSVRNMRDSQQQSNSSCKGCVEYLVDSDTTVNEQIPDGHFKKAEVSPLGAKIVSALLRFHIEANRSVLESIASIEVEALKRIACDPVGSKFIIEVVMEGPASLQWAKLRILTTLKHYLVELAENRFAWHALRKAYNNGSVKIKTMIVKALEKSERRVAGSKTGQNLLKHCSVTLFKKNPDQWRSASSIADKRKRKLELEQLLQDMDHVTDQAIRKKQKRKKPKKIKKQLL